MEQIITDEFLQQKTVEEKIKHIAVYGGRVSDADDLLSWCINGFQFRLGMLFYLQSSPEMIIQFRSEVIKSGYFMIAIEIAGATKTPLTRSEIVRLGNKLAEISTTVEEVEFLVRYAEHVPELSFLDRERLCRQILKVGKYV